MPRGKTVTFAEVLCTVHVFCSCGIMTFLDGSLQSKPLSQRCSADPWAEGKSICKEHLEGMFGVCNGCRRKMMTERDAVDYLGALDVFVEKFEGVRKPNVLQEHGLCVTCLNEKFKPCQTTVGKDDDSDFGSTFVNVEDSELEQVYCHIGVCQTIVPRDSDDEYCEKCFAQRNHTSHYDSDDSGDG